MVKISPFPRQARLTSFLTLCCVTLLWIWYFSHFRLQIQHDGFCPSPDLLPDHIIQSSELAPRFNVSRIAKATVAVNTLDSPLARRALDTHRLHNHHHGYRQFVATNEVVGELTEHDPKGRPRGAWSKPAYLLSLIVTELQKDERSRLEWILSVHLSSSTRRYA